MIQKVYKDWIHDKNSMLPGDLQRSPDESFSQETLVFIDETFLEKLSKYFGNRKYLKVDGNFIYKQKAVDVLMAMDLTNVPLKYPQIKKIILISSDSDFVPVIENLKENRVKTVLYTYYEKIRNTPFSRSNHLIKSVYKYVLLTKDDFSKASLIKEVKNEKIQ